MVLASAYLSWRSGVKAVLLCVLVDFGFRSPSAGIAINGHSRRAPADSEGQVGPDTSQIATPLLITCCERERCWPGQSQQLYDRLRGPRALIHFSSGDAADPHGELLGPALREKGIFDWLERYMGFERGDDV
jgi:hypothetical protein